MMRRGFLGALAGMIGMTVPGEGGQQQRPFTAAGQQTPTGVQAGVSAGVDFARTVVVFGPTGAPVGVFIYQAGTTPGAGNGPVLSGTLAADDLYKNAVEQGWVSYSSPGSAQWARLFQGELAINVTASQETPGTVNELGAGGMALNSGTVTLSDSPAEVQCLSVQNPLNTSGKSNITLGAETAQLINGVNTIPGPAPSVSGADGIAIVNALITLGIFL